MQTIADTLIDNDAKHDPATAGYVPRSTLRYAIACVDQVPVWIRCARVAQGDSDPELTVELPATLPRWYHDEPTTRGEIEGLRAAYEILQARVETALRTVQPDRAAFPHMRRMLAEMASCAEYAEALLRPELGPVDRGEVRWRLLEAIRHAFELGQVLALPTVAEVFAARREAGDEPSVARELSWLDVRTSWLVLDGDGARVGLVQRIRGDRGTGEFGGLDVNVGVDRPILHVAAASVRAVRSGEVVVDREPSV